MAIPHEYTYYENSKVTISYNCTIVAELLGSINRSRIGRIFLWSAFLQQITQVGTVLQTDCTSHSDGDLLEYKTISISTFGHTLNLR